jgi:hypothetical protein
LYACFMKEVDTKAGHSFGRGCITGAVILRLAAGLMLSTTNYLHQPNLLIGNNHLACNGDFGAGLPFPFLCDYRASGNPTTDLFRIGGSGFPLFSPLAAIVDILFFAMHLGLIWLIVANILHKDAHYRKKYAILLGLGYIVGLLSAFMLFQHRLISAEAYLRGTPTPIISTPTPFGTPPPPESSPIPTVQT